MKQFTIAICGNVGAGKTWLATKLQALCIQDGMSAKIYNELDSELEDILVQRNASPDNFSTAAQQMFLKKLMVRDVKAARDVEHEVIILDRLVNEEYIFREFLKMTGGLDQVGFDKITASGAEVTKSLEIMYGGLENIPRLEIDCVVYVEVVPEVQVEWIVKRGRPGEKEYWTVPGLAALGNIYQELFVSSLETLYKVGRIESVPQTELMTYCEDLVSIAAEFLTSRSLPTMSEFTGVGPEINY